MRIQRINLLFSWETPLSKPYVRAFPRLVRPFVFSYKSG